MDKDKAFNIIQQIQIESGVPFPYEYPKTYKKYKDCSSQQELQLLIAILQLIQENHRGLSLVIKKGV